MKFRRLFILFNLAFVFLLLGGCATPRVEVPSSTPMLGTNNEEEKIPIRDFSLLSDDKQFEVESDMRFLSGVSRGVLFPKQAREFIAQDLKDYMGSRFRIDPTSEVVITLDLQQAHSYFTFHSSGLNWIPYVGIVSSIADGFQQTPVSFIVEVNVDVKSERNQPVSVSAFIKKTEEVTGWSGTLSKHREIYNRQIEQARKELFERLDNQLLTNWQNKKWVGPAVPSAERDAATLASELARLDSALADEKISQLEHQKLVDAVLARYSK